MILASAQAIIREKYSNLMSLQQQNSQFSSIDITYNGDKKTYYIATDEATVAQSETDVDIPYNGRGYIIETPTLDKTNP